MTLVIPTGYGNAALEFSSSTGTAPFVTTIGVDLSEVGGDFVGAADAIFTAYASNILVATDNDLTLNRVVLAVGSDGPGGSVDSSLPPANGTSAGTFAPVAMAPVIRKTTTLLGRSGRGRMFAPGLIQESGVDPDGSLTNTFRTQLQTVFSAFFGDLVSGDEFTPPTPPVVLHSQGITLPPTPITGLSVTPLVGWIRGRIR